MKKIAALFLLLIWSALAGVRSAHSHHEHTSTTVEQLSAQTFFTATHAHHPCPVCEYHLTGTLRIFIPDFSPLLIPLTGKTFQSRHTTRLLHFRGDQPADRGPPAIL